MRRFNRHALADDLTALVARLATGSDRFFCRDLDSPPLCEAIETTQVDVPAIAGTGVYEAPALTPAGRLDPAFRVARWIGPDRPTLVYLQGSGERPFDDSPGSQNSFKLIVLDASPGWDANLVVLRAPFHTGSQKEYARAMGKLGNFTSMLAAMVVLTDRIVTELSEVGSSTLVTGISLGGWAVNLHAACFGSAGTYIPLLAGTALDDLFLRSGYRHLTGRLARKRPDHLRAVLNFEREFRSAPGERVFPLLAEFDRYIRYEPQARSYGDVSVATMERGHVTALASPAPIRRHLRGLVPAGVM